MIHLSWNKTLLATDNHLGYAEKDPIRGGDSFAAFEEILQLAQHHQVDALLLAGDLFHENKPSRHTLHTCVSLLRHYCFGGRASALEFLSDAAANFGDRFGTANYLDENFNVALPVFGIHGNHDDPTEEAGLSAMDLLSASGLLNYFGKAKEVDDITMSPILLRKGETRLALYGLGSIRDERLHRTFLARKVKMLRPEEDADSWFNLLLFHQNRAAHSATSYIPPSFLDDSLHLVVWGHEHECRIAPEYEPLRDFWITQPGSSTVTSLCEAETKDKKVALVTITGTQFHLEALPLQSTRPFLMREISLREIEGLSATDNKKIEKILVQEIEGLLDDARVHWQRRHTKSGEAPECPLPLIRLKVDYSGGFVSFNPLRFGQQFVNRVANPKDVIYFYRKRTTSVKTAATKRADHAVQATRDEGCAEIARVEDLVSEYLNVQALSLFPKNEFSDVLRIYVEKDDRDAIDSFVRKSLEQTCAFVRAKPSIALIEEELWSEIARGKREREVEWEQRHPGFGAVVQRKSSLSNDLQPDPADTLASSVSSRASLQKRSRSASTSGRGRGRARPRGASMARTHSSEEDLPLPPLKHPAF